MGTGWRRVGHDTQRRLANVHDSPAAGFPSNAPHRLRIRRCEMSTMTMLPVLLHSGGALIASPSSVLREQVVHRLNGRCRPVQQALGGADALAKLEKGGWQILFLDRRLPDLDAEELIALIERRFPEIQVVMLDSEQTHS